MNSCAITMDASSSRTVVASWVAGGILTLAAAVTLWIQNENNNDKMSTSLTNIDNILQTHRWLSASSSINLLDDEDAVFPDLFPLQVKDYIGFGCAVLGLMLAAGGGIGGGGILVPIYILLFDFPVKRKLICFSCFCLVVLGISFALLKTE